MFTANFVLSFWMRGEDFFSTSFQKAREEKKVRGRDSERAAPCSQHAVIISLCGGELYCFPLVLSQSNNLFCCPCSISSDSSLLYGCYVYGRFWSISAMFWTGEPAVCQPSGWGCTVSWGSMRVGGDLHLGALKWMAAGQWRGQPPAIDVIAAFLVSTPSECVLSHGCFCRTTANRNTIQHF